MAPEIYRTVADLFFPASDVATPTHPMASTAVYRVIATVADDALLVLTTSENTFKVLGAPFGTRGCVDYQARMPVDAGVQLAFVPNPVSEAPEAPEELFRRNAILGASINGRPIPNSLWQVQCIPGTGAPTGACNVPLPIDFSDLAAGLVLTYSP
jgi:hypothetical protein